MASSNITSRAAAIVWRLFPDREDVSRTCSVDWLRMASSSESAAAVLDSDVGLRASEMALSWVESDVDGDANFARHPYLWLSLVLLLGKADVFVEQVNGKC